MQQLGPQGCLSYHSKIQTQHHGKSIALNNVNNPLSTLGLPPPPTPPFFSRHRLQKPSHNASVRFLATRPVLPTFLVRGRGTCTGHPLRSAPTWSPLLNYQFRNRVLFDAGMNTVVAGAVSFPVLLLAAEETPLATPGSMIWDSGVGGGACMPVHVPAWFWRWLSNKYRVQERFYWLLERLLDGTQWLQRCHLVWTLWHAEYRQVL